jgi:hypothetical protein
MRFLFAAFAAAATLGCAPMAATPAPTHGLGADMLAAMRADAARRTGAADDAVRVASVQPVTWPDASIGCPQPGMAYAQMLVPGWLVRLEAGGRQLGYHAARGGRWVMCPPEQAQPPLATQDDPRV